MWYVFANAGGYGSRTEKIDYHNSIGEIITSSHFQYNSTRDGGILVSMKPSALADSFGLPSAVFEVEPLGRRIMTDSFMIHKTESIRVIREITDLNTLFDFQYNKFIQFLTSLSHVPWFQPDGNPDLSWKLYIDETLGVAREVATLDLNKAIARHTATKEELWSLNWDVVRDAAIYVYVEQNNMRIDVWKIVREVVRTAISDNVPKEAIDDAAWQVATYALYTFFVRKNPRLETYHTRVKLWWEVWQKGYGMLKDLDGEQLYVYCVDDVSS